MTKLCINCKHLSPEAVFCLRKVTYSLVTGKIIIDEKTLIAEHERNPLFPWFRDCCGSEGKYWSKKE